MSENKFTHCIVTILYGNYRISTSNGHENTAASDLFINLLKDLRYSGDCEGKSPIWNSKDSEEIYQQRVKILCTFFVRQMSTVFYYLKAGTRYNSWKTLRVPWWNNAVTVASYNEHWFFNREKKKGEKWVSTKEAIGQEVG